MFKQLGRFLLVLALLFASIVAYPQYASEAELKKAAEKLFIDENYAEALPLFSQLLSLYPKDPDYNYKLGACMLFAEEDKEKGLKYLNFATGKANVDPEAYFFEGRAYHLNYEFDKAVESYTKFKSLSKSKVSNRLNVDYELERCRQGKKLLSVITDLIVMEQKTVNAEDFFRAYDLSQFGGKLIQKPEEFQSDFEKKKNIVSTMYLPDNATRVYFSRQDDKSKNGRDLFYADLQSDGTWGTPVSLGSVINSEYDDDFPFMHPNGNILYFSSKGHNSMGGYDVFKSFYDESSKSWSAPVNLDFAINTPADDYLFITDTDEKTAYFSSNRYSKHGKTNVYHIEMERLPLVNASILGTFKAPNTKSAKISIQNLYDNSIIATFNTNNLGEYRAELPSSGKFRFLVESENSNVTHAGVVELKNHDPLSPLFQSMEIIGAGDDEQLVIKNNIGAPDADVVLTPEVFKTKARLKVNAGERSRPTVKDVTSKPKEIAQIDKPAVQQQEAPKELPKTDFKPPKKDYTNIDFEKLSETELITLAKEDAAELNREAALYAKKSSVAKEISAEKNKKATELAELMNSSLASQEEKNTARNDYNRQKLESEIAFNLSKEFDNSATKKTQEANDVANYALKMEQLFADGGTLTERSEMQEMRKEIESIHSDVEVSDGDFTYNQIISELAVKEAEWEEARKKQEELTVLLDKNREEINQNSLELSKAKGSEKSRLNANAQRLLSEDKRLKSEISSVSSDIIALDNEIPMLEEEKIVVEEILAKLGSPIDNSTSAEAIAQISSPEIPIKEVASETTEQSTSAETQESTAENTQPLGSIETEKDKEVAEKNKTSDFQSKLISDSNQNDEKPYNPLDEVADIDVYTQFAETKNSDYFLPRIQAIENSDKAEVEKAKDKGTLYDDWAERIDNESYTLKYQAQKERKEDKKMALEIKAADLDAQRDDLRRLANAQFSFIAVNNNLLSSMPKGTIPADQFEEIAEQQKIGNLLKESYHQSYSDEFSLAADIENDFLRTYKSKDLNKRWIAEIDTELDALYAQKSSAKNAQELALIDTRITNLTEIKRQKQNVLARTENNLDLLSRQAFKPSYTNNTSPKHKQIDMLTEESQRKYFQAVALRDSSQKIDDEALRVDFLKQADLYEQDAFQKMTNAFALVVDVNKLANSNSDFTTIRSNERLSNTDSRIIEASSSSSGGTGSAASALASTLNAPKADFTLTLPEVDLPKISVIENEIAELESKRIAKAAEIQNESDTDKKELLKDELAAIDYQINRKSKSANVLNDFDKKMNLAEATAQNFNPENSNLFSTEYFQHAEKLNQEIIDSLNYALFLVSQAEVENDENEKQRLFKEAKFITERANAKNQEAEINYAFAVQASTREAKVLNNQNMAYADISSLFPELGRSANEQDLNRVSNSAEYKEFTEKNEAAFQLFKDANVLYQEGKQNEINANEKIRLAKTLYFQAAQTEDATEKERLFKEAQVLETTGKSERTMALAQLEQANKKFNEAKRIQKEAIVILENADEAIKESAVALEKSRFEGTVPSASPLAESGQKSTSKSEESLKSVVTRAPSKSVEAIIQKSSAAINTYYKSSPYSASNPIPLDPPMPLGIVYKVQIGAFNKPIRQDLFGTFAPISGQKLDNGLTRFYAGLFDFFLLADETKKLIQQKGYPDAFVVAFLNGNRIPLYEARKLERELGATAQIDQELKRESGIVYFDGTAPFSQVEGTETATTSNKETTPKSVADRNQGASASSQSVSILQIEAVDGLFYTVQIGAFSKQKSVADLKNVNALMELQLAGLYRYYSGIFESKGSADQAKTKLVEMGFTDAFVVPFKDGDKIANAEAKNIVEQSGPSILAAPWDSFEDKTPQKYTELRNQPKGQNTSRPTSTISNNASKVFKVQLGAYKEEIPVEAAKTLLSLSSGGVEIEKQGDLTIYVAGRFQTAEEATKFQNEIKQKGFSDAFVVVYEKGKKTPLNQYKK